MINLFLVILLNLEILFLKLFIKINIQIYIIIIQIILKIKNNLLKSKKGFYKVEISKDYLTLQSFLMKNPILNSR